MLYEDFKRRYDALRLLARCTRSPEMRLIYETKAALAKRYALRARIDRAIALAA